MPPSVFTPFFSPQLAAALSHLPFSPETLSRTPIDRLTKTALPNLSCIELVSATDFATLYDDLYIASFPRRAERERSDLIVERLAAQARGERSGRAPYRIVGIRDHQGRAIGAAQFSVLPLPSRGEGEGSKFAVPYLQYIYIRPSNRRQDMSEVLHTMVLAVASADAAAMDGRSVPFTLFETEPPGHGHDASSRAYALVRSKIHTSSGGVALVLRRDNGDGAGEILSAHVQPGLEDDDPPLTLVWVIRQSPNPGRDYEISKIGSDLVAAYYQSLRDEGFPEENIRKAEMMVEERCKGSVFQFMPLADVRDFSPDGHLDVYAVDDK